MGKKDVINACSSRIPTELPIALLLYDYPDKSLRWKASVYKSYEDGKHCYLLSVEVGTQPPRFAGNFFSGKALVKFVEEKTREKFAGITPTINTLDTLRDRSPSTAVPHCYLKRADGQGCAEVADCPDASCPYTHPLPQEESYAQFQSTPEDKPYVFGDAQKSELQDLVAKMYGAYTEDS